ncbi:MAG: YccF domain-containing protein [Bacteroidales bacterium]|nr:YccF domain-containing protein [Bacteroidales bacterium]
MRILANLVWLIFGGLEAALGYFTGSLALALTIIGLPLAWQTFRLGLLCLWPFGAEVHRDQQSNGCLSFVLNVVWFVFGGFWTMLMHLLFGLLLCLTIVGLPWGLQHFKLAGFALTPFGRQVTWQ